MKWTVVYDEASGLVQRWVMGHSEDVFTQPGEALAHHEGSMIRGAVVAGGVVVVGTQAQSLSSAQADALLSIDEAAGRARLRYITDVPGQQATYTRKEQQAREWTEAGYPEPAPSFILAEAQALGTTPQAIAQQVIALADYWAYVKGPEIEAARIKHKAAVRSATTLEAVQAALDAAMAELEAL